MTSTNTISARSKRDLYRALERVMFCGQWLLIDADNRCVRTVRSLDELRAGLAAGGSVTTVAARLVDGALGADIDAEDPVIGDAIAEALVAWCIANGLPYLVRESGRRGGRHVITAITHNRVQPSQWRALCRTLAGRYRVVVDDRTGKALRLLTAPHRHCLPSRIIGCTLTPADVVDARSRYSDTPSLAKTKRGTTTKPRAKSPTTYTGASARSRSEAEFRVAMVLARRGWTIDEAWTELHYQLAENAKAFEQGRDWWARYVWLIAITTVAAEQGLSAADAWALVVRDQLTDCGRDWWDDLWSLALADAATDRPRATRLLGELSPTALDSADPGDVEAMCRDLHAVVDATLSGIDPRRRYSVLVVLCALVPAFLVRGGSMSVRHIAEQGHLHTSTVTAAIATATEYGLLAVATPYAGGSRSCHRYELGKTAQKLIEQAQRISPHTSCSTPAPRPLGASDPTKLATRHAAERTLWTPRSDLLAVLLPGERLATSQHPLAKTARSNWHQRRWWNSLTPEQQAERTRLRRSTLGALHRSTRRAWLTWLDERARVSAAADRISAGAGTPPDGALVSNAPLAFHRGLSRPPWAADPAQDSQETLVAA